MPFVIKEHPNAILRTAGRYSPETFEQELLDLAKEKGVSKNVEILHQIPWLDNFKRTASAYAGLVIYKITENNKIGMPNRIFETMVCGLPVIATDLPELRRVVIGNNCGLVTDTDKPEEIAKTMNYLLSHPDEAKQMGENGRKAVLEKYNYERILDNTITFYTDLLNAK
jgi:glycosyltransferase involved in cell wall biosynthesis